MKLTKPTPALVVHHQLDYIQSLTHTLNRLGMPLVYTAQDAQTAATLFNQYQPGLCLLEASMSLELINKIRQTQPSLPILCLTQDSLPEQYEQLRAHFPIYFLPASASTEALFFAIDTALLSAEFQHRHQPIAYSSPNQHKRAPIFFKVGDTFKSFPLKDIAFFYADEKHTFARIGDRNYPSAAQLKTLEESLPGFARIHKSYLVNTTRIDSVNPKTNTVLLAVHTIPIGNAYRRDFLHKLHFIK